MRNLSHNVNLIMFHFLFFKYFMVCAYFIHFVLFKYLFCVRFKFIKNHEVMVLISPISGSNSAIYFSAGKALSGETNIGKPSHSLHSDVHLSG